MGAAAAVIQGMVVAIVGTLLGVGLAGNWGGVVLGAVSAGFGVAYGRAVWWGEPYSGAGGLWRCLIDATWSSLNTWAGAVYYGANHLAGNRLDADRCRGTGSIWLVNGVVPHYATTIGCVKAGSNDRIDRHEEVHVFQARLFGPLYLPLVGLNYAVATVIPYWLFIRDPAKRPITGFRSYFENGVYPHVWNELWAYRVSAPSRAGGDHPRKNRAIGSSR